LVYPHFKKGEKINLLAIRVVEESGGWRKYDRGDNCSIFCVDEIPKPDHIIISLTYINYYYPGGDYISSYS